MLFKIASFLSFKKKGSEEVIYTYPVSHSLFISILSCTSSFSLSLSPCLPLSYSLSLSLPFHLPLSNFFGLSLSLSIFHSLSISHTHSFLFPHTSIQANLIAEDEALRLAAIEAEEEEDTLNANLDNLDLSPYELSLYIEEQRKIRYCDNRNDYLIFIISFIYF